MVASDDKGEEEGRYSKAGRVEANTEDGELATVATGERTGLSESRHASSVGE